MTSDILINKLKETNIPYCNFDKSPPSPAGNYGAIKIHKDLAYISGQMPFTGIGILYPSHQELTNHIDINEIGYKASQIAVFNAFLQLVKNKSISEVKSIVKVEGFFRHIEGTNLPKMLDGASDLITNIFPDNEFHARTVYGVTSLPYNAFVELSIIAEIE
ncbi:RidA family protein [uncultured Aquimarina sp.]|uniref:RidA family protein n=1 Tax=uncultured Aquimarina sp. TaxID=575652 RepID=UPI00260F6AFB|nr:RidA family protein [uncultured Aquimarina sp.]